MKRAAACRDAAEQAPNGLSPEEAFILVQAEEATNRNKAEEAKELAKSKAEKALTKTVEGAYIVARLKNQVQKLQKLRIPKLLLRK